MVVEGIMFYCSRLLAVQHFAECVIFINIQSHCSHYQDNHITEVMSDTNQSFPE